MMLAATLVAILATPAMRWLRLTLPVALVIFGFLGSELVVWAGRDTGLRWPFVADLTLLALIPLVIFDAAYRLRWQPLQSQAGAISLLIGPLWFVALGITAIILYFFMNHPTGVPWLAAWLAACILAATDPGPLFRYISLRDQVTLEGETLGSDTAALVGFAILVEAAQGGMVTFSDGARLLAIAVVGGAVLGVLMGTLLWALVALVSDSVTRSMGSVCLVYFGYVFGETGMGVSGVVALVPAAIMVRLAEERYPPAAGSLGDTWQLLATMASTVLFLLLGATVTVDMFQERWLAMVFGIVAVVLSRGLVSWLIPRPWLPPGGRSVIFCGGLRGTVVVALALMLPTQLPYWWTIQSIAYGVVLFTLFIQLPFAVTQFSGRQGLIK